MRRLIALCALALVAAWPAAAVDGGHAARIDELFADLKLAETLRQSEEIRQEIIMLWHDSGDADIDHKMRNAIAAMSLDRFDLALTYLDDIVADMPDYAEGWNKRATVYFMQQRYDESLADVARTLALEPRHFGALAGLGMIMLEYGDRERALEAYRQALAVDPHLENVRRAIEQLGAEDPGQGI